MYAACYVLLGWWTSLPLVLQVAVMPWPWLWMARSSPGERGTTGSWAIPAGCKYRTPLTAVLWAAVVTWWSAWLSAVLDEWSRFGEGESVLKWIKTKFSQGNVWCRAWTQCSKQMFILCALLMGVECCILVSVSIFLNCICSLSKTSSPFSSYFILCHT